MLTQKLKMKMWVLPLALVGLVGMAVAQDQGAVQEAKPLTTAQKQFAHLKTLVGDWVAVDEEGNATEEVVSRFALTAGGSAIIETEFPGQEHEMVTLFHLDGDDLILAHYCVMQNQPQMKAVASDDLSTIAFKCTGKGTNMKSEADAHMHDGTYWFTDENHYKAAWNMKEAGEVTYTAEFSVARADVEN